MEQVWITKVGAPEKVLELRGAPDPEPSADEVRVRVHASGVNFADIMARLGLYPDANPPVVVGYEVSGVVDKVGADTHEYKVGDRVIGACRLGGYSDVVVLKEPQVFPLPQKMSFAEGASIPVNYLTAYQMLFGMGRIKKGDVVFVHSLGGGVGFACIDLCHVVGARVIGTASSHKRAMLLQRGVEKVFDPNEDFWSDAKKIGVDLVLDPVGGRSWKKGLEILRPTGRLVVYGFSSAATGKGRSLWSLVKGMAQVPWFSTNPLALMHENKGVLGVYLGSMWDEIGMFRQWAGEILDWYGQGKIHPTIAKEFPLADASSAHHFIQDRKNIGKVVLVPA